jgi:DNA-binding NarL/FixJ family response regulator
MEALKAGAHGYALKGVGASELVDIVRTVASGGSFVSPTLAARLLKAMQDPDRRDRLARNALASLAPREEQILELVAKGLSNKEVARQLDLQEKTVKHYMTSILQKLHVRNRVEAALLARDAGGQDSRRS